MSNDVILVEEASLEIVPKRIQGHRNCKGVEEKFGTDPSHQILDDNFHHEAMLKLSNREKRGRPDIVHFAVLDITSTPLYLLDKVSLIIHTVENDTIYLGKKIRIPRTLHRFNGLMSKILSKETGSEEEEHFTFKPKQTFRELIKEISPSVVFSLTRQGALRDLSEVTSNAKIEKNQKTLWIVGGFPRGHFASEVIEFSDHVISISEFPLAAHVVTARLAYDLERSRCNDPR